MKFDQQKARDVVAMVARVRAGEARAAVSKAFGVSRNFLDQMISAANRADLVAAETRQRVVDGAAEGFPVLHLAREFLPAGIRIDMVRHIVYQAFVDGRIEPREAIRRRVVALRLENRSLGEIARTVKVSETLVRDTLAAEGGAVGGIDCRGVHPRQADIAAAILAGETDRAIAARLGIDAMTVARVRDGHVARRPVTEMQVDTAPHPLAGAFEAWQATQGVKQARLVATRWTRRDGSAGRDEVFAAFDVEAADERVAAADARPLPTKALYAGLAARSGSGASCALGAIAGGGMG